MGNGSRRWFGYTSDDGTTWAVELDESKYEGVTALGFGGVDSAAAAAGRIIRSNKPLAMRYVNASAVNGDGETVRQKFYCGQAGASAFTNAVGSIVYDGLTYAISGAVGERRVIVPAFDTAITDGDVDANFAV